MSNDLISRSAVMDYLREQQANVIIEKNKNGIVPVDVCEGMRLLIEACMNFIVQVPVAYDVDKIAEQLKESALAHDIVSRQYGKDGYYSQEQVEQGITRGLKVAIGIVKAEMKG